MFSFFHRKQSNNPAELDDVYDMTSPIPAAIVVTCSIVEGKLDHSQLCTRLAHRALKAGDLRNCNDFLCEARTTAEEAVALMLSADVLHKEILIEE